MSNLTKDPVLQKKAEEYVEELPETPSLPISVLEADHFVGREQILKLIPQLQTELTESDAEKKPTAIVNTLPDFDDIVITEYHPEEKPNNLIVRRSTPKPKVPDLSEQPNPTREMQINIEENIKAKDEITLTDILQSQSKEQDSVYYIRTVNPSDYRGIWGIIAEGITQNFAQGITVSLGDITENYQIEIPTNADRLNADASSSFLGRMIYQKSIDSHVFNFKNNRMGKNPNLIYPGQELVIVNFKPTELTAIYSHFANAANSNH